MNSGRHAPLTNIIFMLAQATKNNLEAIVQIQQVTIRHQGMIL